MKKIFFYLLVATYVGGGIMHFIFPNQYNWLIPSWLPYPTFMIYLGGLAELSIGIGYIMKSYRRYAAIACVGMLIVFLVLIHIPQAIQYIQENHPYKTFALVRIPFQFVLIWWAWIYKNYNVN